MAVLDHANAAGQTLEIGGPNPVSWLDVIAAFEHEIGREIAVIFAPLGAEVPELAPPLVGLLTALEAYDTPLDMSDSADRFGIQPTSLHDFVHTFVARTRHERQSVAG